MKAIITETRPERLDLGHFQNPAASAGELDFLIAENREARLAEMDAGLDLGEIDTGKGGQP